MKKEITVAPFSISVRIAGHIAKAEGTTLEEAIQNTKLLVKKGICLMAVTHKNRTITKLLNRSMTNNLFNVSSRVAKEVAFKNIKTIFTF